jgi:23S rRNA pseudouridine2605 synthase
MVQERLQKIISQAGLTSRRKAEEFITQGRVKVNGVMVNVLGSRADPKKDTIEVDGFGTLHRAKPVHVALHKPIHVISTVEDPEGRPTVVECLEERRAIGKRQFEGEMPRVFPIGRLDFDAEGLILLSNDGTLANELLHPRHHVPKTYLVKIRGGVDANTLERLKEGVRLSDEHGRLEKRKTKPADVTIFKEGPANTWLELTITEGRNHQVKRMCEAVRLFVIRLIRTEFAGISIDPLGPGEWRFLSQGEVKKLKAWHT